MPRKVLPLVRGKPVKEVELIRVNEEMVHGGFLKYGKEKTDVSQFWQGFALSPPRILSLLFLRSCLFPTLNGLLLLA